MSNAGTVLATTSKSVPPLAHVRRRAWVKNDGSVNYYLHLLLEGRSVEGLPFILHPKVKNGLRAEGWSELDIERVEQSVIDDAEDHPRWTVTRYVPRALHGHLAREGREDLILHNRLVAIPTELENGIICDRLSEMFPREVLISTPGIIQKRIALEDGACTYAMRLDLEPWLARRGFMVPMIQGGSIAAFRVYRRPDDERPFTLRSREVGLNA